MAENCFELVGRLTWVDIKYYDSGTCVCKTFLSQRTAKKDEENKPIYNSFLITFIDSPSSKYKSAEEFANNFKKDDYVKIKGVLTVDKFVPKDSSENKAVEKLSLIGRVFNKVVWDEFEKRFVDV